MKNLQSLRDVRADDSTAAPLVSVLMPCLNAQDTLDEAMHSILTQSLESLEVIAVDDGSTDATPERLRYWAAQDRRVILLEGPHRGIIAALNNGLAVCRAALIARMDADDRSLPERLTKQVAFMHRNPDTAVVGCRVKGFPAGRMGEGYRLYLEWLNELMTHAEITRELFIESPLVHPSVVVRSSWLEQVGGYQERGWAEDYDLWLRLSHAGARFAKVPEILFYWREDPERLTRTDSRYAVENFLRAKAHYLRLGPLADRDAVIIWGAGQMGRRIAKHLQREGVPLHAFIDIDPHKIGRQRRGCPIHAPEALPALWAQFHNPAALAAVGSRGARALIRARLNGFGLREGEDYWAVA